MLLKPLPTFRLIEPAPLLAITEQALLVAELLEKRFMGRRCLAPAVELHLLIAAETLAQVSRYPAGYLIWWRNMVHFCCCFMDITGQQQKRVISVRCIFLLVYTFLFSLSRGLLYPFYPVPPFFIYRRAKVAPLLVGGELDMKSI